MWEGDAIGAGLPLRILAGVNACVLKGRAPSLAFHYKKDLADLVLDDVWIEFQRVLKSHQREIRERLAYPPQMNDVQRSAALLVGFLFVASKYRMPLAIREIGASGGLNLWWDKFHYSFGAANWGPSNSDVRLHAPFDGDLSIFDEHALVSSRSGCDIEPRDLSNPQDRTELESNIWPGQRERLASFRAAADIASKEEKVVVRSRADSWLELEFDQKRSGEVLVIFHSAMWDYMPFEERTKIEGMLDQAGKVATMDAPLAHISLEFPKNGRFQELKVRTWPSGEEALIATVNTRTKSIVMQNGSH